MVDYKLRKEPKNWTEMARCLYLMRSGDTVKNKNVLNDYNKSLSRQGIQRVLTQKERFKLSEKVRPDCILCSTALRTRQTVKVLSDLFSGVPVFERDALYLAPAFRIIETLSELDTIFRRVMIVSHHSGLDQLLAYLTDPKIPMSSFNPADCAVILLPEKTNWQRLFPGIGRVDYFFNV